MFAFIVLLFRPSGLPDGLFVLEKTMLIDVDYKKFQEKLNAYKVGEPYTLEEAVEAFHNLVGLVQLFRTVERELCSKKSS